MTLADKIVVIRAGKIEQAGTTQQLYSRPATSSWQALSALPRMNFLGGHGCGRSVRLNCGSTFQTLATASAAIHP